MPIFAYVGLPGAGKSYGVVANQIMPALKAGRLVVTNIPLNEPLIRELVPDANFRSFDVEGLAQEPDKIDEVFPPGCVAVIDEAWRLWPAGVKTDKVPTAFKSWLAESRHRLGEDGKAMQVCIVTQDLAQLGAFSRMLVEQTFHHAKLGNLGLRGSYRVSVYQGAVTGQTPPQSKLITQSVGRYNKRITALYQSHTMSEAKNGNVDEAPVDNRGVIWRRPGFIFGVLGVLSFVGYIVWWSSGRESLSPFAEPAVGGAKANGAGPAQVRSAAPGQAPPGNPLPHEWRVAGSLLGGKDGGRVLLTDGVRSVWVAYSSYCRTERTGLACHVKGRRIAESDFPL